MRFTIKTTELSVSINAQAGAVVLNGLRLMPHEAAMMADALNRCADRAESIAAETAAALRPVAA